MSSKKKKAKRERSLPMKIWVRWDRSSGEPFLLASDEGADKIMDGDDVQTIGIYHLVQEVEAYKQLKINPVRAFDKHDR